MLRTTANVLSLKLLVDLLEQERGVSELATRLNEGLPTISQRLKYLYVEALVTRRREGSHVYYALADRRVVDLLRAVLTCVGVALAPGACRVLGTDRVIKTSPRCAPQKVLGKIPVFERSLCRSSDGAEAHSVFVESPSARRHLSKALREALDALRTSPSEAGRAHLRRVLQGAQRALDVYLTQELPEVRARQIAKPATEPRDESATAAVGKDPPSLSPPPELGRVRHPEQNAERIEVRAWLASDAAPKGRARTHTFAVLASVSRAPETVIKHWVRGASGLSQERLDAILAHVRRAP